MNKKLLVTQLVFFGIIYLLKELTATKVPVELWLFALIIVVIAVVEDITREDTPNKGQIKHGISLVLLSVLFSGVIIGTVLEYLLVKRINLAISIIGFSIALIAIYVRGKCVYILGKNFSEHVEIKEKHKLITTGPYKKIRHPIYLASILLVLSLPLILNSYLSLFFSFLAILGVLYRIKLEEKELTKQLNGYKEYMKNTSRLIPYFY